jgi:hypothetical protein
MLVPNPVLLGRGHFPGFKFFIPDPVFLSQIPDGAQKAEKSSCYLGSQIRILYTALHAVIKHLQKSMRFASLLF